MRRAVFGARAVGTALAASLAAPGSAEWKPPMDVETFEAFREVDRGPIGQGWTDLTAEEIEARDGPNVRPRAKPHRARTLRAARSARCPDRRDARMACARARARRRPAGHREVCSGGGPRRLPHCQRRRGFLRRAAARLGAARRGAAGAADGRRRRDRQPLVGHARDGRRCARPPTCLC
eukprot:2353636-Prymnesium_polylepis.1